MVEIIKDWPSKVLYFALTSLQDTREGGKATLDGAHNWLLVLGAKLLL